MGLVSIAWRLWVCELLIKASIHSCCLFLMIFSPLPPLLSQFWVYSQDDIRGRPIVDINDGQVIKSNHQQTGAVGRDEAVYDGKDF